MPPDADPGTMAVVDSLPARPLRLAEVDALADSDAAAGVFPVTGRHPSLRDVAVGMVVVIGSVARALAFENDENDESGGASDGGDGDGWTVVGTLEVATTPSGAVALEANDAIDDLQDAIRTAVDDRWV